MESIMADKKLQDMAIRIALHQQKDTSAWCQLWPLPNLANFMP
jgi:hypothetical protein